MDYETMAFSYATEGSVRLSEHFKVYEFRCKDNTNPIFVSLNLVDVLERIREHFKKPVYINSAYRNPAYNAMIGGAKNSMHMYGMAADIHINGVTPNQIADFAETVSEYIGTEYDLLYVYEDGTYREVRGLRKIPDGLPCPVRDDLDYDSVKRTLKKRRGVFRGK